MYKEIFLLVAGLIGLWLGSNLAINGAKNVARHFRLSGGFIGLTILSIGTSVPELAVGVAGGIDRLAGLETSGIVIGNIVGSAANQLTIILGLIGLFGVLYVSRKRLLRDAVMLFASILLLVIMSLDGKFTVFEGYVMILIYLVYLFFISIEEKIHKKVVGRPPELHLVLDALRLVGGLLLVAFASNYVVKNGIALASAWGVTQTFVGIFIIGLGTGLPELAVSIAALRKGEVAMSVGNLIGSNICDLLFSLGAGAVITGFLVPERVLLYDLPALLLITLAVFFLFWDDRRLTKKEAVILILLYLVYLGVRLWLFG
ncbi:sodium:calcium antiporter [Candidatus Woesearchaeota archaeon]|nr:sodium:calcium antiporter [Candidatus Woesearchaeota archaeon]MBW3016178.1 sodium:calcium antiporter [Candidatus Woesearchaeota archaeon]